MNESVIHVEDVIFSYPGKKALNGLTLTVERGAVTGLLGPNGSGKTTLMRLLNGLMPPDKGHIRVLGLSPWKERVRMQRSLAYVPEHPAIYPVMKVNVFIDFCSRNFPGWDRKYVLKKMAEFDIPLDRKFSTLSRGQKGMASFLTALGRRSDVLLLDDPTLGLDVAARKHLYGTIVEELSQKAVTILFATHLPAEVEGVLTHAAFIKDGKITAQGPVEELKTSRETDGKVPSLEDLVITFSGGNHVS